ncbi:MAG: (d)CMP kinase [SAR86 cluster bacterium]|jgi:CMP/dCMP kinase|nr:(d)CMP kinase [SAR86 cluster bacterium]|tara:strand:- start:8037 stop:8714 length:678 start_codon:yes stop_codon:yes gene_type:complete
MKNLPVITIDGPSGSGKGTISQLLARELGWNILDSGALYRSLAYFMEINQINLSNFQENIEKLNKDFNVEFISNNSTEPVRVILNSKDVTSKIRTEEVAKKTSDIASSQKIRNFIKPCQRAFLAPPGLIADGRDMGTVIFPKALLKIYLTASHDERAKRRYSQLKTEGTKVNMRSLSKDMEKRDQKDSNRKNSPLSASDEAIIIDTTDLKPENVITKIVKLINKT